MQAASAIENAEKAKALQIQEQKAFASTILLHVLTDVQYARLFATCKPYIASIEGIADALAEQEETTPLPQIAQASALEPVQAQAPEQPQAEADISAVEAESSTGANAHGVMCLGQPSTGISHQPTSMIIGWNIAKPALCCLAKILGSPPC